MKRDTFSSAEYGVAVSPRVSNNPNPPRGGGRYLVGNSYTVRGETYTPREQPDYVATGQASWYGADFHGRRTANGEIFSANAITGAHPTLPLPSYVRVTNLENGRSLLVRINDRGPYVHGRIVDLSYKAAALLGYTNDGTGNVQVQYVGPAPLNGDDTRMLLASLNKPTAIERRNGRPFVAPSRSRAPQESDVRLADMGMRDPYSMADAVGDVVDNFANLFSYADGADADALTSAAAAADMLASQPAGLEQGTGVRIELGVFRDPQTVDTVAIAFAALAAVDEETITVDGVPATRLTLSRLKPGVAEADVAALARQLGLDGPHLY